MKISVLFSHDPIRSLWLYSAPFLWVLLQTQRDHFPQGFPIFLQHLFICDSSLKARRIILQGQHQHLQTQTHPTCSKNMFLIRGMHECLKTAVRFNRAHMGLYLPLFPHLHRRVFMVRSGACGQLDGCDPKTPDVCFEVVTFHLHTNSHSLFTTRDASICQQLLAILHHTEIFRLSKDKIRALIVHVIQSIYSEIQQFETT